MAKGRWGTLRFFLGRASAENIESTAGALSFSTALAVVPALAVVMGTLASFPAFENLRSTLQDLLTSNLMPHAGMKMQNQIAAFVAAAGKLTAFGTLGLAATAILLLFTIEGAFNRIFRVTHQRPLLFRAVVLWAVLTATPFLFAISLTVFGYYVVYEPRDFVMQLVWTVLGEVMPALLSWLGFALLYVLVPNRRVRWRDAVIGAAVSAGLFTLLRAGFGFYVSSMTSYSAIYGALAAVPVFLLWIFLIWYVILAGAVITAALPDWRLIRAGLASGPSLNLAVALELLNCLSKSFRAGRAATSQELALTIEVPEASVLPVLEDLRAAHYVAIGENGRWMLVRDLETVPLAELIHRFGFGIDAALAQLREGAVGERVARFLAPAVRTEEQYLHVSLGRILDGEAATPAPRAVELPASPPEAGCPAPGKPPQSPS
jgi:membrane protein